MPHNMAPLSPYARPVPPKRSLLSLLTAPQPSRCSGSQGHEGLPFPHFIASAGAVSVSVRVVLSRGTSQPQSAGGAWAGRACTMATPLCLGHAHPIVAMAARRCCPMTPKLRHGFISVGVARCMGVVVTMGVVTKRGGAAIQAGLAHHPARAGRGS